MGLLYVLLKYHKKTSRFVIILSPSKLCLKLKHGHIYIYIANPVGFIYLQSPLEQHTKPFSWFYIDRCSYFKKSEPQSFQ